MKLGITRWKVELLKLYPFSPVHRARKFSEVLGTTSLLNSMMTFPTGAPSAVMSKKTLVVIFASEWVVFGHKDQEHATQRSEFDELQIDCPLVLCVDSSA